MQRIQHGFIVQSIPRLFILFVALALISLAACAGSETSRSTGTYVDDKTISAKIEAKLVQDEVTKALQIEVITYKGAVQLNGFVDNKAAIGRAEEIARSVDGVKSVTNNLTTR